MMVSNSTDLPCDGCGQAASAEHIARRLRRLEWAKRFRPVHIHTLLLGGVAPREDAEVLYAPGDEFRGVVAGLLLAVRISTRGKPPGVCQESLSMNLACPVVLDDGRPFRFSP